MTAIDLSGIEVHGPTVARAEEVLTPEALAFVARLHREFNPTRERLLAARHERQARLDAGELPDFLPETAHVRRVTGASRRFPQDLQDRRVEITGPVDRKMIINALNSGRQGLHGRLRGRATPHLGELRAGSGQPDRRRASAPSPSRARTGASTA
jgi:malate synthase